VWALAEAMLTGLSPAAGAALRGSLIRLKVSLPRVSHSSRETASCAGRRSARRLGRHRIIAPEARARHLCAAAPIIKIASRDFY
jgi:hypothetical protein